MTRDRCLAAERPKRIDVPLGTLGEYGHLVIPRMTETMLHQMYRAFPDSPAAKGRPVNQTDRDTDTDTDTDGTKYHRYRTHAVKRAGRKLARLVPGTHW